MQELRLAGITPEMELWSISRTRRRRSRPTAGGISPCSWLELRLSRRRKVRFPTAGGSVPVRLLDGRSSAATLVGHRWLHVTPSQPQKLALVFHEASALELLPLSPALRASSAGSSLAVPVPIVIRTQRRDNASLIRRIAMWILGSV
ncbi:Os01g0149750, partial [Oryza sativa Japonica Group]